MPRACSSCGRPPLRALRLCLLGCCAALPLAVLYCQAVCMVHRRRHCLAPLALSAHVVLALLALLAGTLLHRQVGATLARGGARPKLRNGAQGGATPLQRNELCGAGRKTVA